MTNRNGAMRIAAYYTSVVASCGFSATSELLFNFVLFLFTPLALLVLCVLRH